MTTFYTVCVFKANNPSDYRKHHFATRKSACLAMDEIFKKNKGSRHDYFDGKWANDERFKDVGFDNDLLMPEEIKLGKRVIARMFCEYMDD